MLQIENELYAPIRPKRVTRSGETPSDALQRGGIEYIEVRSLDINPFSPIGVDEQQVRFLGNVSDLPQRLSRTQIFVLATHWEGMPLALVEGMAAGCACVVSDVIGAREVVTPEVNGLRVQESDPGSMADALQRLLQDPALAQRLGSAARAHALSHYGREQMWGQYQGLLPVKA